MDKKERNRKWREAHKEHIREYNIRYNESHQEQNRAYSYPYDPEKKKKEHEKYNLALRQEVLTHYGDGKLACVICGENKLLCLTIDHINGGGNKHRKALGLRAGMEFYRWLRKQGYPLGFRTLCRNCQCLT
ncbi:hypothetical protein LCGC14_1616610 [marine sediment metagenome]|uniref:Uncharacterized protein n=1 Tax=marine sediment metagenome TaxID=412755 RepID=A0A0F9L6P8_9ZZZZ